MNEIILSLLLSGASAGIGLGGRASYVRFKRRDIYRFWGTSVRSAVTIVVPEYDMSSPHVDQQLIEDATTGKGISKGSALAVSVIVSFFEQAHRGGSCDMVGHTLASEDELRRGDLVLLGSTLVNSYAERILAGLSGRRVPPWTIAREGGVIIVNSTLAQGSLPTLEDGCEYAIVHRGSLADGPGRSFLYLAGETMAGTLAAARAVTSNEFLRSCGFSRSRGDLAFLLVCSTQNGRLVTYRLAEDADDQPYTWEAPS